MKKILLATLAVTSMTTSIAYANDAAMKRDAKTLIQAAGYRCDTVDKVNPFIVKRGYTVYCNGYSYSYELEDRGGRWVITPD